MPSSNTLVQLLSLYTNPESTMHSVTDRQTDGQYDDTNSRSYRVAVRSTKIVRSKMSDIE